MAGTVTALKAQARDKERVNVYLDGEFAFGLALIHALWLRVGQKLSDEEIAELQAADSLEKAQQRALNLISYRPRSEKEVRLRLKKAGVDDESIQNVVQKLVDAGLLNDKAFSEQWVDSRVRAGLRGKRMIRWELKQKGVGEQEIASALEGVDDSHTAIEAARRRWSRVAALEPRERKRKLMEYLARNGFDYDTISNAVNQVLSEHNAADSDDGIEG